MSNIIITREELFDLVWSTPISNLSKKYTISDYGLRKVCHSMKVPLPKSGYWEKLRAGKNVVSDELPSDYSGVQDLVLTLHDEENSGKQKPGKTISPERTNSVFRVPEKLTNPDKMILAAKESLTEKKEWRLHNGLANTKNGELNIRVSPNNISRSPRWS